MGINNSMINYPSAIEIMIHLLLIVCIHHQRGIIKRCKKIALDVPDIRAVFVHAADNVLDGIHVVFLKSGRNHGFRDSGSGYDKCFF